MALIKRKACKKSPSRPKANCSNSAKLLKVTPEKESGRILSTLLLALLGFIAITFYLVKKEDQTSVTMIEPEKPDQQIKKRIQREVVNSDIKKRKKKIQRTSVLFVQSKSANMHERPSTKSEVIMALEKGYKLEEIEQLINWVKVRAEQAGGKSGWVQSSFVGPEFIGGSTYSPKSAAFGRFLREFDRFNSQLRDTSGMVFFTEAEDLGDGIIQVTATDRWKKSSKKVRKQTLNTIFYLWELADGSGLPITIYIADQNGKRQMEKSRENSTDQSSNPNMKKNNNLTKPATKKMYH